MGIPQILMIIFFTLNILSAMANHGKLITDVRRKNAFYDILANAILIAILYAGGFWSN